jgi:GNAT superfamily N-acetyltransferase
MSVHVITTGDRPDLVAQMGGPGFARGWPAFIFHDPVAGRHHDRRRRYFRHLDLLLVDDAERVMAGGWGVPIRWNGHPDSLPDGYTPSIVAAIEQHEAGEAVDTLVIEAAQVRTDLQGQGLAQAILTGLIDVAAAYGLTKVVAPVRPTLKSRYPLTPMRRFMAWTRNDGLPLDPWLRTHVRMGGHMLRVAERSMVMTGTVADWESWTGLAFPESGEYVVPDAFAPVRIDREADYGELVEANVWLRHR